MKSIGKWLKMQWISKKFRMLMLGMLSATAMLGAEFYIFEYGILKALRYLILLWCLTAAAWIDYRSRRIPNMLLLILLFSRAAVLAGECLCCRECAAELLFSSGMGFLTGGGIFFLYYLSARGGVGAGDVKLFAVLGYYFGAGYILTAVFLTVLTAALYSVAALLMKKTTLKQELPFAPFALAGTVLTIMLGV